MTNKSERFMIYMVKKVLKVVRRHHHQRAVFQVVAEHSHSPQVTNYIYINVVITTYVIIDTHLFSLINAV